MILFSVSVCGNSVAADILSFVGAKYGYTENTFSSAFEEPQVDLKGNLANAQWFGGPLFGKCRSDYKKVHYLDSIFVLEADQDDCDGRGIVNISSAVSYSGDNIKWSGIAFGGGGYFEASLRFDPEKTIKFDGVNPQWPAFWAMSLEHFFNLPGEKWIGNKVQFSEVDVFEYVTQGFAGKYTYGATVHHWFGEYKKSCSPKVFCSLNNTKGGASNFENAVVRYPKNFNFSDFHRYGVLWVPASKNKYGFLEFFLDGISTGVVVKWKYQDKFSSPLDNPFYVIDFQHLVFVFSTGLNQPMLVQYFKVWQRNSLNNIEIRE